VKRDLIGLLDPSPGRKPLCNPRHKDSRGSKKFGKIMGRRLPLHVGTKGEDHLGGPFLTEALDQLGNAKLFRADAVQRRELPPKGMIATPENTGAFQGKNIRGGFNNAEFTPGAGRIPAKNALFLFGKKSAKTADPEIFTGTRDGRKKLGRFGIRRTHQPEGDPFGTSWSDSRQAVKLPHQFAKRIGIVEEGHG
jgi:hypothetical protein